MADWLTFLFNIGGFGAVLVLALFVMGKWLLKQITAVLNSYVTAYAQETAKIDARMKRLEQLAEEQARLTRTVETIKDEISAQARSRDNRWAFRKDVYVNLISATSALVTAYSGIATSVKHADQLKRDGTPATDPQMQDVMQHHAASVGDFRTHRITYKTYLALSPLAIAEDVVPLATSTWEQVKDLTFTTPELIEANVPQILAALDTLILKLQKAGRKDLWGTPESEAKAQAGPGA